ncbi:cyclin-T1 isoform X2 [Indicator indicator]|uniref:cyclin-T1 isoform X2 n=1 Tax=Indicator indicator TaxID=1002788 RepID=UPI0023DEC2F8|nr:cyclin-T1 isoform X2 [Indicator indicator]
MEASAGGGAGGAAGRRWYFTREQLDRSPSRRAGLDPDKELSYRQQAANLLQDMGQRLNVSQLTINTAIVYMHRFYMVQSFTQFHRNSVVPAALFLAAKVEEQPRKLEHVIKVANACLHHQETPLDTKSEAYLQQAQDLVILESIILQTLGFEITIDHPHTHVVKCTQLVRASKDLAQTSYFMATNSLHLTTFSLQYTPPVVACVCIHLACKWSNWEIPVSTDGKHWWEYVDGTVTLELLDELTHEFLQILEKTPSRLKRIRNWRASQAARKSKPDEHGDDESLSEQTILNMISRNNSSDMNIAGLMSMSTSSTAAAGPPLPASSDSPSNQATADKSQPDHWHPPAKLELGQSHRTNESCSSLSAPEQQQQDGYQKPGGKNAPAAKVSLKEYRAKHAEELAAQKRQLENMEANVRSQYAYAAQNLLAAGGNPSAIILKLPLGAADNPERPPSGPEKADKASALKLRIPVAGGAGERPLPCKQEEIKMRIKVPGSGDRHSSAEEGSTKGREHKEKHKGHAANHHHHHHNHHSHKHLHTAQLAAGPSSLPSKRPSDSKHGSQPGTVPHKSYGPLAASRKRQLPEEVVAAATAAHEHQPKVSKASKGPGLPFPYPHLPGTAHLAGHSSDPGNVPLPQATKARGGTHSKLDKGPPGANGHNASQASDYQDTVNMLHSLLSAQGMQPTQPPHFEFHSYGQLGTARAASSSRAATTTDKPRPPPLPSEPPPPLPPLPK